MNKDTVRLIAGTSILLGALTYSVVHDQKQTKKNQIARKQQEEILEKVIAKAKDFHYDLEATAQAFEILEAKVMNGECGDDFESMGDALKAEKEFQLIAVRLKD